jgi:hypothetical protein
MGGDWDCYQRGFTPEACGALYLRDIKQYSAHHDVVVLLHVRTEVMTGRDGSHFASKFLDYIYRHLGRKYTFAPLDAIPGLLAQYANTLQLRDINGDGFDEICIRGAAETFVGLSNGTIFDVRPDWTRRFSDRQGGGDPAQYQTFSLTKIGGHIGLAGGVSSGIVFQKADPAHHRFAELQHTKRKEAS